jgi:hypothetical protein
MKKLSALIAFCLLIAGAQAQDLKYNDPNAEVRAVSGFTGIKVASGIQLVLTQGATEAVAVSASTPEYRGRIKTVVKNGVLDIYYERSGKEKMNWNSKGHNLKAYVSAVTIQSIGVSSGATTNIDGGIKADNLMLDLSSGSVIKGSINAANIKVEQNSGAVARLGGSAASLTITVSSGAIFTGYDLVTGNCDAKVSSGGAIQITVNNELNASASSGGSVSYKGSCRVTKNTSSGGSVTGKS